MVSVMLNLIAERHPAVGGHNHQACREATPGNDLVQAAQILRSSPEIATTALPSADRHSSSVVVVGSPAPAFSPRAGVLATHAQDPWRSSRTMPLGLMVEAAVLVGVFPWETKFSTAPGPRPLAF